jgi:sterol desaturase/sphingolipid hydroxylase (fatty acid hydroxylase superfamily)
MSWFGKLFATDQAVDNLLDKEAGLLSKTGEWVGNLHYTEEERAEAAQETRQWGLRQLEALAPFKVVQRVLAFMAATFWIVVGLNVLLAIWLEATTDIKAQAAMMSFALSEYVWWPVLAVFALYFTGGVLPSRQPSAKK